MMEVFRIVLSVCRKLKLHRSKTQHPSKPAPPPLMQKCKEELGVPSFYAKDSRISCSCMFKLVHTVQFLKMSDRNRNDFLANK